MHQIDRTLLSIVIILVVIGFLIFSSATLGLLARDGASLSTVTLKQLFLGIIGGGAALFFTTSIHYRVWRKYAFYIFFAAIILTLFVFIPGLGFTHGGARRWIEIGPLSFQPAELLKIGFVIYVATWLSGMKQHIRSFTKGTLPFIGILLLVGTILLLQPDTDTFLIMAAAGVAMFIVAGGRIRDVAGLVVAGLIFMIILAFSRPYIMDRLTTFFDPTIDPQGSSYQINQSLIAVGSGGIAGRGFGQSIQKFEYLPEPIGDSIFAVYSEEFGFFGSAFLIFLFAAFTFRGYRVATHARDLFGMLLVVGFVTLIVTQAFLNIASMLALIPLTGLPLPFISKGGTALLATLLSIGIILNVSKYQRKRLS